MLWLRGRLGKRMSRATGEAGAGWCSRILGVRFSGTTSIRSDVMKERCAVSDARCDSPRHVIDGSVFVEGHAVDKRSHPRRFSSH